jgi:histone H3/H4
LLNEKKCKKRKSKKSSPEKEIKHYQKLGGCLTIGKVSFERLVREITQDYKLDVRFSAEAIIMIQHCLENCVVEMLSKANLSANHAGRVRLFPKDLQFQMNMAESNSKCGPGSLSAGAPSVNFEVYIKRVLTELYPGYRVNKNALYQLNQLANLLGKAIVEKAHFLNSRELQNRTKKTISSREIQSAVRLILPRDLAVQAVSNGVKAVVKFHNPISAPQVKKLTMQERAGLKFSVSRASKFFKKYNTRIGQGAPVYLASVLEYVIAEVLVLARDVQLSKKDTHTVSSRKLKLAIDKDEELKRLSKNLCFDIADGGVVPIQEE